MAEDEIKNNPKFKGLQNDAEQFRTLSKIWPYLKPLARILGVNTSTIDKSLKKGLELANQIDEMVIVPDMFNDLFSDRGWIIFESMELEVAKSAIEIAQKEGIDRAEEFLVNHFSPDWFEVRINWLKYIKGFRERFRLAQLALDDYKLGRYYSSILVTLSLIDGWVGELNIIDFQRLGFFTEKSQLIAWDSISAHTKGLMKLKEVFGKSRMLTRTDEIRIPYRHGIVHGMDLGYDNRYVAAKCWAALFAVRDWAIKAAREELTPPVLEPKVEKTLWESIEDFRRIQKQKEQLKIWQPRDVVIGETIPPFGRVSEYAQNSPERKMIEFLNYWRGKNYGYMAECYAPMLKMQPVDVRNLFQNLKLNTYTLKRITDVTTAVADVQVEVETERENDKISSIFEFRLVCNTPNGDFSFVAEEDSIWGITTWRTINVG